MTNPRADYIPIVDRKPLKLPGDARVAVWVIVNIEEWPIHEPMARTVIPPPQGVTIVPDITNYGWFEYGLRVGFWRIRDVLDRQGVRASVSLNASVCNTYPRIVDACLKSRWELFGHGFVQRALPREQDERAVIRKTIDVIKEKTGQKPRGWMGPGLHETFDTPDILAEEGIEYVLDWVNDDQPYPMNVKKGSLFRSPTPWSSMISRSMPCSTIARRSLTDPGISLIRSMKKVGKPRASWPLQCIPTLPACPTALAISARF